MMVWVGKTFSYAFTRLKLISDQTFDVNEMHFLQWF